MRIYRPSFLVTLSLILFVFSLEVLCDNDIKDTVKDALKEAKSESKEKKMEFSSTTSDSHVHDRKVEETSSDDGGLFHFLRKRKGNLGFVHAFIASLSVIIVSELGDKTFFIAAIMAMRHSRVTVLAGALGALALMTVLSAILGFATTIIPKKVTYYASTILFAVFGIKMLKEGYDMSPDEGQEEYEEVQADLKKREEEMAKQNTPTQDIETGIIRSPGRRWFHGILGTIFLQAFTLTFLAEWGDRSQITTIVLAAREDVIGVIIGGVLGHAICTGIAVLGGRIVAQKISVRTVTIIGGVVFLLFALSAFVINPDH